MTETLRLDGLILPPDLLWTDEFDWTPTEQHQSYSLTGAVIFETAIKQAGRPITLQGGQDYGWVIRTQVEAVYSKLSITTPLVLVLPIMSGFNVRFRHEDKPIDSKPIVDYRILAGSDFYTLTVKLITVEGYVHVQSTESTIWTINHLLGRSTAIKAYTFDMVELPCVITPISLNQSIATFTTAVSGVAQCL